MSNSITELREAIVAYALEYCLNEIPLEYYEAMLDTWNNMNADGYNWDSNNAAAALFRQDGDYLAPDESWRS